MNELANKTKVQLLKEIEELKTQLEEANETIDAIRTGQVDALVVHGENGHQLYTLRSADQTYRVFIEKMAEGAVSLDYNGVILYCNTQFGEMVKRSISHIIGNHFENFVAASHRSQYQDLFAKGWMADCKTEVDLNAEGSNIPVQLSATTLELEHGKALSIIITDLSSQRVTQKLLVDKNVQLEEINRALETSNHDLQQFAYIASHDLQEPIRKIQIFSNMIVENEQTLSEQSRRFLNKIVNSTTRMRMLVTEVLNYSKLSADDHQISVIDLNEIVEDLREHFELVIEEKRATLKVHKLPVIEGNVGQIRQMFQNLLSNALKFTRDDVLPEIEIHSKRISGKSFDSEESPHGKYFLINICDNGIGFDDRYVENIFSLFERLNAKDKFEGAGIGLAIAKKIVEKHDGLITATSSEGRGAEFRIILPVKQEKSR